MIAPEWKSHNFSAPSHLGGLVGLQGFGGLHDLPALLVQLRPVVPLLVVLSKVGDLIFNEVWALGVME